MILVAGLLFAGKQFGWAQNFINLDFESANLSPIQAGQVGGSVPTTNAIPGWTAFVNGIQLTQILQNSANLFVPSISILGPNWNNQNGPSVIQGNYTLVLTSGLNTGPTSYTNCNIPNWAGSRCDSLSFV